MPGEVPVRPLTAKRCRQLAGVHIAQPGLPQEPRKLFGGEAQPEVGLGIAHLVVVVREVVEDDERAARREQGREVRDRIGGARRVMKDARREDHVGRTERAQAFSVGRVVEVGLDEPHVRVAGGGDAALGAGEPSRIAVIWWGQAGEPDLMVVYNEHWEPFTVGNLADWSRGDWKILARSWFGDDADLCGPAVWQSCPDAAGGIEVKGRSMAILVSDND